MILDSQAPLARVGLLVSQDQWDQWDLPDHQGHQVHPMALMTLMRGTMVYQLSGALRGHRAPLVSPDCLVSPVYLVTMETRVQRVPEVHLGSQAWMASLDSRA